VVRKYEEHAVDPAFGIEGNEDLIGDLQSFQAVPLHFLIHSFPSLICDKSQKFIM
jgi:hypothetical protein